MDLEDATAIYRKVEEIVAEARLLVDAEKRRAAEFVPPGVPCGYVAAKKLLRACEALLGTAAGELDAIRRAPS